MTTSSSSSTLVNISENADLRLISLLCVNNPALESKCEALLANDAADSSALLLRTLVADHGAMTVLLEGFHDIEESVSAFSLLASLLTRIDDEMKASALASELARAVSTFQGSEHGTTSVEKKMGMVGALYNLRSSPAEKSKLLARIIQLASMSEETAVQLLPGHALGDVIETTKFVDMVDRIWKLDVGEKRLLYGSVIKGLETMISESSCNDKEDESKADVRCLRQRYLLLLLETFGSQMEVDKIAFACAQAAAIGAIRDPITLFSEQRGMLALPAIVALSNTPATQPLYTLLQIFQEGKLEDFQSFLSTIPAATGGESTLKSFSLNEKNCIRHMRLLSLCSLASEHEEIPYSAIASTLQVQSADVESWVISAVSSGLLSAKMDQLQEVVMVERCVVRRFGMEQWKALQNRLNVWKKNVRAVLEALQHAGSGGVQ